MQQGPRRDFLRQCLGATASAALAGPFVSGRTASALEPPVRARPRLSGVSLAAYSLRSEFAWVDGRRTDKTLEMLGFLDYCAGLGVAGAEITAYFLEDPLTAQAIAALKRRAALNGLEITGGAIRNNFALAPGSDAAVAQVRHVCDWIDRYAELGAPTLRIFAGEDPTGKLTPAQTIAHVAANLAATLPHAERRGVLLGLENHDFTQNLDHLLAILERVDSPWLGVTWDSGNLLPTPDPYGELARIAPYAVTAQIKASIAVAGQPEPADFGRLADILRGAGYAGYVVLEYEEAEDPYAAIPRYVAQLQALLD